MAPQVAGLALALTACSIPHLDLEQSTEAVRDTDHPYVGRVTTGTTSGTGFLVDPRTVVLTSHQVESAIEAGLGPANAIFEFSPTGVGSAAVGYRGIRWLRYDDLERSGFDQGLSNTDGSPRGDFEFPMESQGDIAVLVLEQPVPSPTFPSLSWTDVTEGSPVRLVGYGRLTREGASVVDRYTTVNHIGVVEDGYFCVFEGEDTDGLGMGLPGDSGGPWLAASETEAVSDVDLVVGVNSSWNFDRKGCVATVAATNTWLQRNSVTNQCGYGGGYNRDAPWYGFDNWCTLSGSGFATYAGHPDPRMAGASCADPGGAAYGSPNGVSGDGTTWQCQRNDEYNYLRWCRVSDNLCVLRDGAIE